MEIVTSRDCVCKDDKIFFFTEKESFPIIISNSDEEIQSFKNREMYREIPFDLITKMNNKIYALEISGKYMCEYCFETQELKYIQIDCNNRSDCNFALLKTEGNQIFIFDRMQGLTIYDAQNRQVQKSPYPFRRNEVVTGCKYENCYYLCPKSGTTIFKYDILLKKWDAIDLEIELKQIIHAAVDKNNMLMLTEDGTVLRWDMNDSVSVIEVAKEYYKFDRAASRICVTNNSFIILPSLQEDILIIDKLTHEVKVLREYPDDFQYTNNSWSKYYGYCENEESYFFACRTSQYILMIDKARDKFSWIKSGVDSKISFERKISDGIVVENEGYLECLISALL